jgi:D-arabinose 1-dehydrogenase-like Zn-dependent alcohol dehydrogenase
MRAALLREFGQPLSVESIPAPRPKADEAVIRVRAVGLCGSDLKIVSGTIPGIELPHVPGHEVSGELAKDTAELPAGTRVAAYVFTSCGACPSCRRGETTVCPQAERIGFERTGGLADYITVPASNLLPFGTGLSFERAAVSMDAVLSPWRAMRTKGQVKRGDTVLVVGAGGLGLHAVQVGRALGARVAVIDPVESHIDAALKLGAELGAVPEHREQIRRWAPDGVDVVLESSGQPGGFQAASELTRPSGRIVCCGYTPGTDYAFGSMRHTLTELTVLGSRGGNRSDATEALAAVESEQITPLIAGTGTLDEVNDMLAELRSGRTAGRLVVQF